MLYNLTEQPLGVKQYKLRRAAKTIGCMFKQIGITPCQGYYIRCYVTKDKKLSCGQVSGPNIFEKYQDDILKYGPLFDTQIPALQIHSIIHHGEAWESKRLTSFDRYNAKIINSQPVS